MNAQKKKTLGGPMNIQKKRVVTALLVGLYAFSLPAHAVSCLLFPLSCLKPSKKFGEELEARVLQISSEKTENYELWADGTVRRGWSMLGDKQDIYVWFKVGDTLYQGWHQNTGAIAVMTGYKPKREQWIDHTFKMRFYDETFMGIDGVGAMFKRPDGDEWRLTIISIIGPDGVNECKMSRQVCPPQAKVDRAAREAEELANVQKAGGRSATDVAPMPVDEAAHGSQASVQAPEAAPAAPVAPPEPAATMAAPAPTSSTTQP